MHLMVCASGWGCDNHMRAVRALQKRVARIERAAMTRPSPFALVYGSFDQFVEQQILPSIVSGTLCADDMVDVVAALRSWEPDGTWSWAVS